MALINKDMRIARYSAEEGVGWVPLVPDLATSARFDKYLEETALQSLCARLQSPPQGTQVPIAIYSTNKGDTITVNGTRIPAFKIVAEDLYERCELYDRTNFRVMRNPVRSYGRFQLRPQFGSHILTPTPSGNAVLAHIQKQR